MATVGEVRDPDVGIRNADLCKAGVAGTARLLDVDGGLSVASSNGEHAGPGAGPCGKRR